MTTPPKRVTSLDVARHAGVSRATVSAVLNGRTAGNVSSETRERVLRAAEELHYTRSRSALNLREQRSRTIGIISDEILTSPWAGRMLRAVDSVAHARGYFTLSIDLSLPGTNPDSAVRTLLEHDVDGLIIATMGASRVSVPPSAADRPVVLLNCLETSEALEDYPSEPLFSRDTPTDSIRLASTRFNEFMPDDYYGGYLAAERLLGAGHTRLAMIAGNGNVIAKRAREQGFADACRPHGVTPEFIESGWDFDDGYRAGTALLSRDPGTRPTGVFCIRDRVAGGLMHAAAVTGVRVPRDLSVVGFDDEDFFAEKLVPALTTIALPHLAMGEAAMNTLLGIVEAADASPASASRWLFPCPLVERESVASPPGV